MHNNFARFYFLKNFDDYYKLKLDKNFMSIFQVFLAYAFNRDYFINRLHNSSTYEEDDLEERAERHILRSDNEYYKIFEDKLFVYFYDIDKYLFNFSLSP